MLSKKTKRLSLILVAATGLLSCAAAFGAFRLSGAAEPEQAKTGPEPRDADKQAIRKVTASFLKALEGGDAKAVTAHWTEGGEFVAHDGSSFHGHAAISKAYADFFKDNGKIKILNADLEDVRFLSKDAAVEEGSIKVDKGAGNPPITSRYSITYVREDGKWLMAQLRAGRGETSQLNDLEWLVGRWSASHDGVEMNAEYQWILGKSFLEMRFTVKAQGRDTHGLQILGRDPVTGQIRSWTFENEGGFGHALWTREAKGWTTDSSGVQGDGGIMTATNVMTKIDDNTFTWQSTQRIIDGENVGDLPPVRVTRVKAGK